MFLFLFLFGFFSFQILFHNTLFYTVIIHCLWCSKGHRVYPFSRLCRFCCWNILGIQAMNSLHFFWILCFFRRLCLGSWRKTLLWFFECLFCIESRSCFFIERSHSLSRRQNSIKFHEFTTSGHCHPRIIQALKEQADRVTLSSRAFYNDVFPRFAKVSCVVLSLSFDVHISLKILLRTRFSFTVCDRVLGLWNGSSNERWSRSCW
jgi:hypothetical protein